jgi:hypothetical protein
MCHVRFVKAAVICVSCIAYTLLWLYILVFVLVFTLVVISSNILPLEHRRELHDLTLLYKIKYNLINVTFNQYLTPATNPYATRNFDPNNYNIIVSNNQEFFRQSYFPRTVILWNNLPPNLKAAHSLQIFKHHLQSYYKVKLFTYTPP